MLAPTFFRLFFASLVKVALENTMAKIWVQTKTNGNLLNVVRLKTRTKFRKVLVLVVFVLAAHSLEELQKFINCFTLAGEKFCLPISLKKILILNQLSSRLSNPTTSLTHW